MWFKNISFVTFWFLSTSPIVMLQFSKRHIGCSSRVLIKKKALVQINYLLFLTLIPRYAIFLFQDSNQSRISPISNVGISFLSKQSSSQTTLHIMGRIIYKWISKNKWIKNSKNVLVLIKTFLFFIWFWWNLHMGTTTSPSFIKNQKKQLLSIAHFLNS